MGLRCSKSGHLHEEESLCGDHFRFAPEGGECEMGPRVFDLSSCSDLTVLTARSPDRKKSGRRVSSKMRFSCDREIPVDVAKEQNSEGYFPRSSNKMQQHSPPEGKADVEELFVELPRDRTEVEKGDLVVCLTPDRCLSSEREQEPAGSDSGCAGEVGTRTDGNVDKTGGLSCPCSPSDTSSLSSCADSIYSCISPPGRMPLNEETADMERDENGFFWRKVSNPSSSDWMYTLYDYQGQGVVTKQDLNELMQSLCAVVGTSLIKGSHCNNSSDLPVKVRLEIGHHVKKSNFSPNKYAPSKNYNGFLFPPPNNEEADKVSSYIEEKLSLHRDNLRRRRERQERKHPRRHSHRYQAPDGESRRQKVYALPQRLQTYPGAPIAPAQSSRSAESVHVGSAGARIFPFLRSLPVKSRTDGRISRGSSCESACSCSSVATERHSASSSGSSSSTTVRAAPVEECSIRLRHSCSQHRRLKEERLRRQSCSSNDSLRSERHRPSVPVKEELGSAKFVTVKSCAPSRLLSGIRAPVVEEVRGSSPAFLKSVDPVPAGPLASSCLEPSQFADLKWRPICQTASQDFVGSHHRSRRPAVWPGQSVDVVSVCDGMSRAAECSPSAVFARSCFCKRMLGKDQPCCSSTPLHLLRELEYPNDVYFVPGTSAVT